MSEASSSSSSSNSRVSLGFADDESILEKKFENRYVVSNAKSTQRQPFPRIQVINETLDQTRDIESEIKRYPDDDDNLNDGPPDIFWNYNKHCMNENDNVGSQLSSIEGPTLMEQMVEEGLKAKRDSEKEKIEQSRLRSKKKDTFTSLKKGFLSSANKKDVNCDADEKHIPMPTRKPQNVDLKTDEIPLIRPKQANSYNHPLHMPEVQEQLDQQMGGMNRLLSDSSKWMTPDLMEKIAKNPRLLAAMSDPSFTTALQAMIQNPKSTTKGLKETKAETLQHLKEFCGLLGDHFTLLGETEQESLKSIQSTHIETVSKNIIHPRQQSISEQDQIHAVLQDESLKTLLLDSDIQRVIQECSIIPGRFKSYMEHPTYGPSLRKMMNAGLLQIQ